jgi:hypothetical protein
MLTDDQMRNINDERQRKGQASITKQQAETAAQNAGHTGNAALEFCLGMAGVPWPSAMGVAGFVLHEASSQPAYAEAAPSAPDTSSSYSGGGGDFGGGGSDSSY